MLQALMVKRFAKIVAQLERADSSVEVHPLSRSFQSFLWFLLLPLEMMLQAADSPSSVCPPALRDSVSTFCIDS